MSIYTTPEASGTPNKSFGNDRLTGTKIYCALISTIRLGLELENTRENRIDDSGISRASYLIETDVDPIFGPPTGTDEDSPVEDDDTSFKKMLLVPTRNDEGYYQDPAIQRLFAIRLICSAVLVDTIDQLNSDEGLQNEGVNFCDLVQSSQEFTKLHPEKKFVYIDLIQSGRDPAYNLTVTPSGIIMASSFGVTEIDANEPMLLDDLTTFSVNPFIKRSST